MANQAVSGTLAANTVQTVTLSEARRNVRVVNRSGSAEIWFTISASNQTPPAPTVGGNDCYLVPGVAGASEDVGTGQPPVQVSLISTGTPTFTVEADQGD